MPWLGSWRAASPGGRRGRGGLRLPKPRRPAQHSRTAARAYKLNPTSGTADAAHVGQPTNGYEAPASLGPTPPCERRPRVIARELLDGGSRWNRQGSKQQHLRWSSYRRRRHELVAARTAPAPHGPTRQPRKPDVAVEAVPLGRWLTGPEHRRTTAQDGQACQEPQGPHTADFDARCRSHVTTLWVRCEGHTISTHARLADATTCA
ncbi:hypothetical protein Purlil1_3877 [Purpureocillium lilacinum]|uniref:Uncharacterized protein n=1 Tax=Purpureocillium lilacinum TaxID=33203 RepID=A0ABR0C6N0_PURLI|nr:hypothetical protein Purlil1_3877 [Purpureocillium lilacinum]